MSKTTKTATPLPFHVFTPTQRLRFAGCQRLLMAYRRADGLWSRELLQEVGPAAFDAAWHDPRCHRMTPTLATLNWARAAGARCLETGSRSHRSIGIGGVPVKVTHPSDLDGREHACIDRATLIAEVLFNFADLVDDRPPSARALMALSQITEELAVEIEAIKQFRAREVVPQ